MVMSAAISHGNGSTTKFPRKKATPATSTLTPDQRKHVSKPTPYEMKSKTLYSSSKKAEGRIADTARAATPKSPTSYWTPLPTRHEL